MNRTDDGRTRIGRSFHRHAEGYDRFSTVQKRVVARLGHLAAAHLSRPPERVLDVGCGTGAMLVALADRYPGASLCGLDLALNMARQTLLRFNRQGLIVNGDAERLPFRDGAFDLVVSASTFQWLGSLETGFRECLRVLRGDGLLCVAFFGGRTLWELQECYREAVACRFGAADNRLSRLRRFRGRGETERMLEGLDCDRLLIAQEVEMDYHPDVPGLLRSIKGIGAAIAGSDGSGGLGWRGILSDMARIYWDRFRTEAGLPATYEVVYVLVKRCRGC